MGLISPVGGSLVDRHVPSSELVEMRERVRCMPSVQLTPAALADLTLLGSGAYSPLTGFMSPPDYGRVVEAAELADGTPWPLPITLPVPAMLSRLLRTGDELALRDELDRVRGVLSVSEVYARDVDTEAREVYRTMDDVHPGVRALRAGGSLLAGGEVVVMPSAWAPYSWTPAQTRAEFARRRWSSVVAFQTRNPIHRAHEYLTKVALEQVDGLFVHPLVGATKDDDVPADVRMRCYRALLDSYYPAERVLLATFAAAMRYAGPREAVYHGLVRRNYGCSHFILGRDAAGVGSYYGPYDAQRLYDELGGARRLGFSALKFEHSFYCRACHSIGSEKTCPHSQSQRTTLSGTRMRQLLSEGAQLPAEVTRPEVAAILREAYADKALRASA